MRYSIFAGLIGLTAVAACTGGGPRSSAIMNSSDAQKIASEEADPFVLVDLTTSMAEIVTSATAKTTHRFFNKSGTPSVTIGRGDILDIAIVVTSEAGFIDFTASQVSPISTNNLPPQEVASDGNVNVPALGRVRAGGQTVQQFERFLERRLGEVLVEPSVIVRLSDRRSARVAVLGSVTQPGSFTINQDTGHLLDILAQAGGPTGRSENLAISVSRKGQTRTIPLNTLYAEPGFNIHMKAGDVISLEPNLTEIQLLGGTGRNAKLEFDEPEVTLVDVLSDGGGLNNTRGDRRGIFIYRDAAKSTIAALGADTTGFEGSIVPTVFRLDLAEPTGFFAASRFMMQDDDIVYVADSLNEEIRNIFGAARNLAPLPAEYVRDETIN